MSTARGGDAGVVVITADGAGAGGSGSLTVVVLNGSSICSGRMVSVSENGCTLSRNPGERSFAPSGWSSSSSSDVSCSFRGGDAGGFASSKPVEVGVYKPEPYVSSDAKWSELPNADSVCVDEAKGVAHGSGDGERAANGSANGFASRADRESRSSKPSMVDV